MDQQTARSVMALRDHAWQAPVLQELAQEHTVQSRRFLDTVGTLTQEQQNAIFDYIGLLIEIQNQTLAVLCQAQPNL